MVIVLPHNNNNNNNNNKLMHFTNYSAYSLMFSLTTTSSVSLLRAAVVQERSLEGFSVEIIAGAGICHIFVLNAWLFSYGVTYRPVCASKLTGRYLYIRQIVFSVRYEMKFYMQFSITSFFGLLIINL
jgi:hypothetical protein